MPALAAFIGALLAAAVVLIGPAVAAALFGASFAFIGGNHERGKALIVAILLGAGLGLTANAIGTQVAALAHG